jgi:Zn-dependent protease
MMFSFRIGSIPVRVHSTFLMMTLIFGTSGGSGFKGIVPWSIAVFTGVLFHELGHALMGKLFGLAPEIDLHGMGGATSWPDGRDVSNAKSIAISLAGPLTGIAIGQAVKAYTAVHELEGVFLNELARDMFYVNFWWGVFNLLPILPMDGGNVLRSLLNMMTRGAGEKPARIISIIVAVAIAAVALRIEFLFMGVIVLLFAYQNWMALRHAAPVEPQVPLRDEIQRAVLALERDDGETAARHARAVLARATDPRMRAEASRLLAYALLLMAAWGPLMDLMEKCGVQVMGDDELAKFEHAASELGRPVEARRIGELRGTRQAAFRF